MSTHKKSKSIAETLAERGLILVDKKYKKNFGIFYDAFHVLKNCDVPQRTMCNDCFCTKDKKSKICGDDCEQTAKYRCMVYAKSKYSNTNVLYFMVHCSKKCQNRYLRCVNNWNLNSQAGCKYYVLRTT